MPRADFFLMEDSNARVHLRRQCEKGIVGGYAFGNDQVGMDSLSNRSLLMEFCTEHTMMISNIVSISQ